MIKPLNAVQNNGCDIFLCSFCFRPPSYSFGHCPPDHSLLCHVAFSDFCALLLSHTCLSLSSHHLSLSLFIFWFGRRIHSPQTSLDKRVPEKNWPLTYLHMFYYSLSSLSGMERDLAIFSRHSQIEITWGLFSEGLLSTVNWFGCCQLVDTLWLHCCDFRMVTYSFPGCSHVCPEHCCSTFPKKKPQYYARVEGGFSRCVCSESRDLGKGEVGGEVGTMFNCNP